MKKILITISAIQTCVLSMLIGQNFTFHSNSPFGIVVAIEDTIRPAQTITFFDYDDDGDLDILLTGLDSIVDFNNWSGIHFFMEVQENIGSSRTPMFGERFKLFEMFPFPVGYFFASPGDLNHDGNGDFIVASEIDETGNSKLMMYTNTGMPGPDQFEITFLDAMGIPDFIPESFYRPELVDLDQDGDLDLMNSGFDPPFAVEDGSNIAQFMYARNIGTKSAPEFQGWYSAPYNLIPDTIGELLTSGDIDNDGDIDFIGSMLFIPEDSLSYLLVHLNTPGPDHKPAFTTPLKSPFGLPSLFGATQFAFPELVDIDDDGDLDLFVFVADASSRILRYYENDLCQETVNDLSVTLCEGDGLQIGGETYTEEGDYVITLEDVNGCDSVILLTLSFEAVDNSVTVEENILTANKSGAFYQWVNCDTGQEIPGATNQTYIVTNTGNYAVNITDASGCFAASDCINVVISSVAADILADALMIYPNPADQVIYIHHTGSLPVSSITLISVTGQIMGEFQLQGRDPIDISSLQQGIYFARISLNGIEIIKRLIVI